MKRAESEAFMSGTNKKIRDVRQFKDFSFARLDRRAHCDCRNTFRVTKNTLSMFTPLKVFHCFVDTHHAAYEPIEEPDR